MRLIWSGWSLGLNVIFSLLPCSLSITTHCAFMIGAPGLFKSPPTPPRPHPCCQPCSLTQKQLPMGDLDDLKIIQLIPLDCTCNNAWHTACSLRLCRAKTSWYGPTKRTHFDDIYKVDPRPPQPLRTFG